MSEKQSHSSLVWLFTLGLILLLGIGFFLFREMVARSINWASTSQNEVRVETITEQANEHLEKKPEEAAAEAKPYRIQGTIKTYDGQPLTNDTAGRFSWTMLTEGTNGSSVSSRSRPSETGEFDIEVQPGTTWLQLCDPNYAIQFVGPFTHADGPVVKNQDIVLQEGDPVTIQVQNEAGNPISGAKVILHAINPDTGSSNGVGQNTTADEQGKALFSHMAVNYEQMLSIIAEGYQRLEVPPASFKPGKTATYTMEPAKPTGGVAENEAAQPVPNVKIWIIERNNPGHSHHMGRWGDPKFVGDEEGNFELTDLMDGWEYVMQFEAEGYAPTIVSGIESGSSGLIVPMQQGVNLSGTIKGPIEKLMNSQNKVSLGWSQNIPVVGERRPKRVSGRVNVVSKGGVGQFTISNLNPGEVSLRLGKQPFTIELAKLEETCELVYDPAMEPEKVETPRRDVKVTFAHRGKQVFPTGTLESMQIKDKEYAQRSAIPLKNGVLAITGHPIQSLRLEPEGLIGYWFDHFQDWPDVTPARVPMEHTVKVLPAGAVLGTVLDASGKPAVGVGVSLTLSVSLSKEESHDGKERASSSGMHSRTEKGGKYFLTPIPFGADCTLKITEKFFVQVIDQFEMHRSSPTREFDCQMEKKADMTVQIVAPDGTPVDGVMTKLAYRFPSAGHGWGSGYSTNSAGEVTYPGLNATSKDYWIEVIPEENFRPGSGQVLPGKSNRIQLEPGLIVTGQVLDDAGAPVINAEVKARRIDYGSADYSGVEMLAESRTDAEGKFRFSNLPAAEVQIWSEGLSRNISEKVTATASGVSIVLQPKAP